VSSICELRASAKVAKIESFSVFLEHIFLKKRVLQQTMLLTSVWRKPHRENKVIFFACTYLEK
jgi:hypothetical protein